MINYGFGVGYRSSILSVMANVYYIDFRDEIVCWIGQISRSSGLPITANADPSVHRGVEVEGVLKSLEFLELTANISFNNDHFKHYSEYIADYGLDIWPPSFVIINRAGKRIAGFFRMLANLRRIFYDQSFNAGLAWRYVGRQYLDNSEDDRNSITFYGMTNMSIGYQFLDELLFQRV